LNKVKKKRERKACVGRDGKGKGEKRSGRIKKKAAVSLLSGLEKKE